MRRNNPLAAFEPIFNGGLEPWRFGFAPCQFVRVEDKLVLLFLGLLPRIEAAHAAFLCLGVAVMQHVAVIVKGVPFAVFLAKSHLGDIGSDVLHGKPQKLRKTHRKTWEDIVQQDIGVTEDVT